MKPTERFSDRVRDYVLYRPRYPSTIVDVIAQATGLTSAWVVADIGSGTGLSAEPFLGNGNEVIGVEPNREMREAGDALLARWPRFRSIDGTAEATSLPDSSVDLVVAAQAFHWFDLDATRREFRRILRPGGQVALIWNNRRTHSSPFLREYEAVLLCHAIDYGSVRHDRIDDVALSAFFDGPFSTTTLPYQQAFDLEGLIGRVFSSSYTPPEGNPGRHPMIEALRGLFERHQQDGRVVFEYDTDVYAGVPGAGVP